MANPFNKNFGGNRNADVYIRNFLFEANMALPIQILNPPDDLFPDGFPEARRHWVEGTDTRGKAKTLPPIACTAGHESTGGNCLTCYGKATKVIRADKGKPSASEDLIVPLFDHAKYRKVDDKFRPMNPAMPVYDEAARSQLITGGLKILYASAWQYRKLQAEHDNAQNQCASPSCTRGQMFLEYMACASCSAPVLEPKHLASMTQDQFAQVRYSPHACGVCQATGILEPVRKCSNCGGNQAKSLWDVVLMASKTVTPNKKGNGDKTEYDFSIAPNYALADIDPDELQEFWTKLKTMTTEVPSIVRQSELLGIAPPKEWLQAQPGSAPSSRPYGTR